ncbi:Vacuolar protein sorting-associated protein 11, partial [Tetrabaena socialis]
PNAPPQPRVFQNSRCSASGAPLELPVVHFLCGHSYNLRQLGDSDRECPLCAPDQRRVLDIRRSMQAASLQPERFFAELREAADGFSVVAEHLGRGIMNVTPAVAAAAAAAGGGAGALAAAGQAGGMQL